MAERINVLMHMYAPRKTGAGVRGLNASYERSSNKIVITSEKRYMWYLERGYQGFVMRNLAGKTIPIRLPDGRLIFRKATAENIGKHRIIKRDPVTGRILKGNTPYTWQHPAQEPMRFMERAVLEAKKEYEPFLKRKALKALVKDTLENESREVL